MCDSWLDIFPPFVNVPCNAPKGEWHTVHYGRHKGTTYQWLNIEDRTPTETTDNAATETPSSGPSLELMAKAETLQEATNICYSALEMLCLKQASHFDQMNASISLQRCSQEDSMSVTISITTSP